MATKSRKKESTVSESRRNSQHRKILDGIKAKNSDGLLLTDDVVAEATPEDHPLHVEFEWNDSVAAHEHRKAQANALIRRVYIFDQQTETPIPAFVSLKSDREKGGGYRPINEVLSDWKEEYANDAKRDLEAWTRRWKMVSDLVTRVAEAAGIKPPKKAK